MEDSIIEKILTDYEAGRVSRRQLIAVLSTVAIRAASTPAAQSTFQGVGLNHIAIGVTNIQRSRDFYQKHFGLPILRQGEDNCSLGLGKDFLTLFKNEKPGLDHYCIAIQNFQADAVVEELVREGLKPRRPAVRIGSISPMQTVWRCSSAYPIITPEKRRFPMAASFTPTTHESSDVDSAGV
jgi:Glyoxalase/Bleomycin resistance protein/Dioxygenase superfamily